VANVRQMDIYLRTGRLALRHFTGQDAALLYELHNDPEVMRFLNGGLPTPLEEIAGDTLPRFIRLGFLAAFERRTGDFLGWFHLFGEDGDLELGYRLHRAAWGKGYATEGALALIDKAFTDLGARRVHADTMTVNIGSRRVMEKSGLRFVRTFFADWPHELEGSDQGDVEYELLRSEWEARQAGS
jgi:RimJ/RimL family protein N-acetyltransferase